MELWQADEQLKAAVHEMYRQPTSAAHVRAVFEMELAELGLPERDEDVVQPPVVTEQKRNDDTSELTISPNALEEFEKRNPENPAATKTLNEKLLQAAKDRAAGKPVEQFLIDCGTF
jgi:hypothetical protein